MMDIWREMGVIAWPLAVVGVLLLAQVVRAARALGSDAVPGRAAGALVHPVLLWGVLGAALGFIGTLVGLTLAAGALARAGTADPGLVWGAVRVALPSSVFGLLLLGFASIAWLALQFAIGRRVREAA